jgi:hypothetical protein
LPRLKGPEQRLELHDILREAVGSVRIAAEGKQRPLVCARSSAKTKVDPSRIQRLERAELLRDDQR